MFDDQPVPRQSLHARGMAISTSVVGHLVLGVLLAWLLTLPRSAPTPEQTPPSSRTIPIWIPGSQGGGRRGGANQTKGPDLARQVGEGKRTVPTARAEPRLTETVNEPVASEAINLPATPLAASFDIAPGVIEPSAPALSNQGPGSDGIGPGVGKGADGHGSGLDRGFGDLPGNGPGDGVSSPQVVREVKPSYTTEAMRARLQGVVLLACVVRPDGTVGDLKIIRSLDKAFGLDEEAVKAARQWRFVPARRAGAPVAVWVTIELGFTLH